nr:MAG TPA: hypothetical protein [Herelleviridae sp.]
MSNLAKDWQEGSYTVRVTGNLVEALKVYKKEVDGHTCYKKSSAQAKCDPEDEFSLSMGVALAMDRLSKELSKGKIKVGDIVTVRYGNLVNVCGSKWVLKNIKDPELLVKYAYGRFLKNGGKYKVIAIAKDCLAPNVTLAYIQRLDEFGDCYVIDILGLEKA